MGGLFSSNEQVFPEWKTPSYSTSSTSFRGSTNTHYTYTPTKSIDREIWQPATLYTPPSWIVDDFVDQLQARRARQAKKHHLPSVQITDCDLFDSVANVVSYTLASDADYNKIKSMITNRRIKIHQILKVHNEFLERSYQLKNEEKIKRFGPGIQERLLFHGTSLENARKICTYNFDWRLCDRGKFGQGVSFSSNAKYASEYSDKDDFEKVMIVAKVSIVKAHAGNKLTILPENGYDTTNKRGEDIVLVKFEDAEFYPAYLMYYYIDEI